MKYEKLILKIAIDICHDSMTAQDVVNDSLVKLINKIDIIKTMDGGALVAYVATVAKNITLNTIRNNSHIVSSYEFDNFNVEQATFYSVEEMLMKEIDIETIKSAFEKISPEERQLIEEKCYLGFSHKEIAEMHGISEGNARIKFHRAGQKIRMLVNEEGRHEGAKA